MKPFQNLFRLTVVTPDPTWTWPRGPPNVTSKWAMLSRPPFPAWPPNRPDEKPTSPSRFSPRGHFPGSFFWQALFLAPLSILVNYDLSAAGESSSPRLSYTFSEAIIILVRGPLLIRTSCMLSWEPRFVTNDAFRRGASIVSWVWRWWGHPHFTISPPKKPPSKSTLPSVLGIIGCGLLGRVKPAA